MTGGQDVIGATAIPDLTRKLQAEGVERTVVLAEEPAKYSGAALASNAVVRDRAELPRTLKETRDNPWCHSHHLRPGVRGREAAQALARKTSGTSGADCHQRRSLRGLWRLRQTIQLREPAARGDTAGAEDAQSISRRATRTIRAFLATVPALLPSGFSLEQGSSSRCFPSFRKLP